MLSAWIALAQSNETPNSETPSGENPVGTDDRRSPCGGGGFRNFFFRFRPRTRGDGEPRDVDYGSIGRQGERGFGFPGYDRQRFWRQLFYGNRNPPSTYDYPSRDRDEVEYL